MSKFEIALFDADGVVIAPREKFFTDRLVEECGVSPEDSMDFVKEFLMPSMTDKVDLREELPALLTKWEINKSVDEIFEFWWSGETKIDYSVLNIVDQLKHSGVKTYLASDQEKNKAGYIMNTLGLIEHFDGAFLSFEMGFQKHDEGYWKKLLESLRVEPSRIIFWDDDQKNVDNAAAVGIVGRLYSNFEEFKRDAQELYRSSV
ncbi:HAD-IA family hydrolase [Candidatus Woesebacteria bacterium]|nr:HAD-IA family hydrolase [Candidatus Woesebacteria bacterium]